LAAMTETEARMINEFVAGADVPTIAARYSVSEDYVDHLVDQTHLDKPIKVRRRFTWSINVLGNRAAYSFFVAILINIAFRNEAFSLAVGLIVFLILTAIVSVVRRQD
jgi:hypothetical protein